MTSHKYISFPFPANMVAEHCIVSAFLKNIFARCTHGGKDAGVIVCCRIADARKHLEQIDADIPAELSLSHLEAAELALADAEFRYVIVSREDRPVLFLYFQVFTVGSQNFNIDLNRSFVKNIVNLFLDLKRAKVLVAGNAMRSGLQPYYFDKNALMPADVMDALATVSERLAESDNAAATILPALPEATTRDMKMFARMGYSMPWEDSVMEMEVREKWTTLQDYINDLARKYKARANKILSGMDGITTTSLSLSSINKHAAEISNLFRQVVGRQPFTLSTSGAAYMKTLKELHGDDFEVIGYFKDKHLVGFCSGIISAGSYEVYYVGFDAAVGSEYPLYFHMLLTGLERAILLGKPLLKLGRTSFDAKASLGALPVNTGYQIKLRHVPDVAIKWFTRYFSAAEDHKWKLRNPLKAQSAITA